MQQNTVLVTGASSGIGYKLALNLARRGDRVIALGRDSARLARLAAEKGTIVTREIDLARTQDVRPFAGSLLQEFPDLSTVIVAAAIQEDVRLDDPAYGDERMLHEVAVNFLAPLLLASALLPELARRPNAVFATLSTGLAFAPKSTSAVYSASKAGLLSFSDALRNQFPRESVLIVDAILPLVDTPMTVGRGGAKISADEAALAIIDGIDRRRERILVGKARFLPLLMWLASGLLKRRMRQM